MHVQIASGRLQRRKRRATGCNMRHEIEKGSNENSAPPAAHQAPMSVCKNGQLGNRAQARAAFLKAREAGLGEVDIFDLPFGCHTSNTIRLELRRPQQGVDF
jgi:hypothetical protein